MDPRCELPVAVPLLPAGLEDVGAGGQARRPVRFDAREAVSRVSVVTTMHPADRTYRNQTVRLSDLAVINDVIENVTFENCVIEGPAVIVMLDSGELMNSGFEGPTDAILWVIPDDRDHIIGAVGLRNCTVVGCSLRRVGLVVHESEADEIRSQLNG